MVRRVFSRTPLAGLLVTVLLAAGIADTEAGCGYKTCATISANLLNVHLVPHSHDDVGWLKTVDQYYYGSQTDIQRAGVAYILDSVVAELEKSKDRRFIYVESAFFFKWWSEQTSDIQKQVKKLVEDGRLEFAGGAWSMNDEAAVHYQSVIDQFTIGLKKLDETFGSCGRPRVGWQIDPFGHSREMASLFAQMGFEGQFFARMDWVEKSVRKTNITTEMIWKASASLGESAELFTGLLYNHYSAPPGFCFDTLCQDEPIIDGESTENNVDKRVDAFISYVQEMSLTYRTNNVMVPMGDDFNYQSAAMNFRNMDKLIKHVNDRQLYGSKVNVFYSTPSCYLKSLYDDNVTWPNKTQDFFPYSTDWHTYWTGYYSSRPTQKRFEREGNHFLQVCKQLTTLANLTSVEQMSNLDKLREVMGVMQHHDAITGTEKQKVASDYDQLLDGAITGCQANTKESLQKLTNLTLGEFERCRLSNISVCDLPTKTANFSVTLFNPLGHESTQFVRIPVIQASYVVKDKAGKIIPSQLLVVPDPVQQIPYREKNATHELVFEANVTKLETFYVQRSSSAKLVLPNIRKIRKWLQRSKGVQRASAPYTIIQSTIADVPLPRANYTIVANSRVSLNFSSTGHLVAVQMNGVNQEVTQDFFYYRGASGNNAEFKNRSSGAYVFRPDGNPISVASQVQITVINGSLVQEVHQKFNEWISQVIRIYNNKDQVEFEWLVGPIPITDGIGKEIITRFSSPIASKGVFYTDSNGREMLKRVRNQREGFTANLTENVSGNYYPITAKIAIEDDKTRIVVLNDRAQGGSSVNDGSVELMLHRRLLNDDAFGVGEALNETAYGQGLIARGKYYLIISSPQQKLSAVERVAQLEILLPFAKFFSSAGTDSNVTAPALPAFNTLPSSIHLLTLEPWSNNDTLLRLENFLDATEGTNITFSIRSIFDQLGGTKISETTLDGSLALGDLKRLKFFEFGSVVKKDTYIKAKHTPLKAEKNDKDTAFSITFEPMQIRTFIIKK